MRKRYTPKTNPVNEMVDKIIDALEAGTPPWRQPWDGGVAPMPLRHMGTPYRGSNVLALWAAAGELGYTSPYWMTFNQAKKYGGAVRKGEHGHLVIKASTFKKTGEDGEDQFIPYRRGYKVFNADQVDKLPDRFYRPPVAILSEEERLEDIEHALTANPVTGQAVIEHRGTRAYYAMKPDLIVMPPFEVFERAKAYYATLAHELVHWTRHPSRLDRKFNRSDPKERYAIEELVAEIGAALACSRLGLPVEMREDHAGYIQSWLKVLRNDRRVLLNAASHSQKAVDFLLGEVQEVETEEAA